MPPVNKTFIKGSYLFRENDSSKDLYIIQSGQVRVFRKDGLKEIDLCLLGKGAVFGEMALIDGRPRSASVVATEDTEVAILSPDDFSKKTQDVPAWFYSIMKVIIQRLRDSNKRLHATVNHNSLGNVAVILHLVYARHSAEPEPGVRSLDLKLAKREIISILGLTLAEVNQRMDDLATTGFVSIGQNQVRIAEPAKFSRYARYLRIRSTMDGDRKDLPAPVYGFLVHVLAMKDKGQKSDKGLGFPLSSLSEIVEKAGKETIELLGELGFASIEEEKSAKMLLVNEARLDEFELVQEFEGAPVSGADELAVDLAIDPTA